MRLPSSAPQPASIPAGSSSSARLRAIVPPRYLAKRTLRAAMIAESHADKLLAPIYTTYTDVETTILAHAGDIQLTLLCAKSTHEQAKHRVDELAGKLEEALEDWLYSSDGESLEQIVLYYLGLRQSTLAVAESCTGGLVASRITSVAGASRSFLGGAIVYSDALKHAFAGVSPDLIAKHGAVSEEVAKALATGIRLRTGATLGLAVTGIAGPTGGTEEKPVGLVHIALSSADKVEAIEKPSAATEPESENGPPRKPWIYCAGDSGRPRPMKVCRHRPSGVVS
jgi:nicotinamide-nucleotide amidase